MELFGRLGGLEKLERERPSTGYFGNWGILAGVKHVAEKQEVDIRDGPGLFLAFSLSFLSKNCHRGLDQFALRLPSKLKS